MADSPPRSSDLRFSMIPNSYEPIARCERKNSLDADFGWTSRSAAISTARKASKIFLNARAEILSGSNPGVSMGRITTRISLDPTGPLITRFPVHHRYHINEPSDRPYSVPPFSPHRGTKRFPLHFVRGMPPFASFARDAG